MMHALVVMATICPTPMTALMPAPTPVLVPAIVEGNGKLVVDGVATTFPWTGYSPTRYRFADGRTLLYDPFAESVTYIWDPTTKQLTSLGRSEVLEVPGKGMLVMTHPSDTESVLHDIDPKKPLLRELWRTKSRFEPVGVIDGAFAVLDDAKTLVCIGGKVTTKPLVVPKGYQLAGGDSVRGHRVLLLGTPKAHKADISILDLDTGKRRSVGSAKEGLRLDMNVPAPYFEAMWSDTFPRFLDHKRSIVDVKTEKITIDELPEVKTKKK